MKHNKVLFVDDEAGILSSIRRSVIDEDYNAMFALSGETAIEVIKKEEVSVIVTDMKMAAMNGLDLLRKVKELSPNTVRIVLSGYTQLGQILATVNSVGVFKYITKPWNDELDFLPSIREAVSYYNLKIENDIMKKELEENNLRYQNLLITKDELIKKTERDIINIRTINNAIIQIQNILIAKVKSSASYLEVSSYYLQLINDIYTAFLNTFPATIERFSTLTIKEGLIKKIDKKIFIEGDSLEITQEGNYRLLLLVVSELVNYLVNKQKMGDISVAFITMPMISIKISTFYGNFNTLYKTNIEFKLIINFLRELIKTMGGNLKVEESNEKEILLLSSTTN